MSESYVLKTDRNAQWQKIESRLSETATKKQIKVCRDYFLDGLDNSKHFTWSDRFRLYHNPTLEGWQKLFDEEIQEPLTDGRSEERRVGKECRLGWAWGRYRQT